MTISRVPIVAAIAAFLIVLVDARADTVFSNLGTGNNVYNGSWSLGIQGNQGIAFSFTPTDTFSFSELDLALQSSGGPADIALMGDSSGNPGPVLQSWTVTDLPPYQTACCGLLELLDSSALTLDAGELYWVAVAPGATSVNWFVNFANTESPVAGSNNTSGFGLNQIGEWSTSGTQRTGAFAVYGSPVSAGTPEPGSFALMFAGGALALLRLRFVVGTQERRRTAP